MTRVLVRVFPYFLLIPPVAALLYIDGLLYPYLAPKTLLIRAAFILATGTFAYRALSGVPFYFERLRNKWTWTPAVLLVWAYISSLFGIDFYHSFWSIFDRGDGLLTLTAIVGFFYLTLLYADDVFVRRLFAVIAWTSSLAAVFGVLQWLQWVSGIDLPLIPGVSERVSSTFGNPTFFSSYIALSLFVTLIVAPLLEGKWQKWAYGGAALQLLGVLAGATRGALVAMVLAACVAFMYFAWRGVGRYRTYARIGIVALVVAAALFFAFRTQLAQVPFAPISRLAQISLRDTTVESRLFIWQNGIGEALKSPIVGVGAEHVSVLFNRFYDPTQILEEWFDRTHNAFLDYLVQYGIPGFLLYLALIVAFVHEAYLLLRSSAPGESRRGLLFLLAAIVYAVQNFFVFDTALTLWLFMSLLAAMFVWRLPTATHSLLRLRLSPPVALAAGGLIALLVIPVSLLPLRANMLLAEGYLYQLVDARRSVGAVEKGLQLGTYADMEYGYQLYEWYTERQTTRLEGGSRLVAYRAARDVLKANAERYPYDARTLTYYAHVLDVAPKGEEPEERLVREVLAQAINLSPKRIQPRYLLANVSIKNGDASPPKSAAKRQYYEEAIQGLADYSALVPAFAEPYYIIATLYQTLGDRTLANEWAAKGLAVYASDTISNANTAKRASRFYVTYEDWENARRFLRDYAASEPENFPVLYDLAKTEFLAGNPERAREIVEELRVKAPGLVETDPNFLRALAE